MRENIVLLQNKKRFQPGGTETLFYLQDLRGDFMNSMDVPYIRCVLPAGISAFQLLP